MLSSWYLVSIEITNSEFESKATIKGYAQIQDFLFEYYFNI